MEEIKMLKVFACMQKFLHNMKTWEIGEYYVVIKQMNVGSRQSPDKTLYLQSANTQSNSKHLAILFHSPPIVLFDSQEWESPKLGIMIYTEYLDILQRFSFVADDNSHVYSCSYIGMNLCRHTRQD